MIFGNTRRFAVEVEFYEEPRSIWMNGFTCYWFSGRRIGDFEVLASLRDVLFRWERMSCYKDRTNAALSWLDTTTLFATLYSGLYNTGFPTMDADHELGIEGLWERHNINPGTAAFMEWLVFLVESETVARCVYGRDPEPHIFAHEQLLEPGEFDAVLQLAIDFLLAQYQSFGGT